VKVVSDGPIYHLYFAVRWWKAARLELVPVPFGENAATYFPAVGDLWFTWLVAGWGGDQLAKVGQAPFLVVAAVASYATARRLGASRDGAALAVGWFVTSTPLILVTFEPNVDTIFVAGYLAASFFFARAALGDQPETSLALGAIAAGGAWGTKPTGTVFVPPLLALAVLFSGRLQGRLGSASVPADADFSHPRMAPDGSGGAISSVLVQLVALAGLSLLMPGFWFARNAVLTGNPLYPLDIPLLGWIGWYGPEVMRQGPYYLPRGDWRALVDIVLSVLDPRLAPFWLAAILGGWAIGPRGERRSETVGNSPESALLSPSPLAGEGRGGGAIARPHGPPPPTLTLPRKGGGDQRGHRIVSCKCLVVMASVLAIGNVALYWLLVPYRTQQRFFLQALGLAAIPLARLLGSSLVLRFIGIGLLTAHVFTGHGWPWVGPRESPPWDATELIPNGVPPPVLLASGGLAIGALAIGCLAAAAGWVGFARRPRLATGVLATALLTATAAGWAWATWPAAWGYPSGRFYPMFPDFHRGWMALERVSGPDGTRVAYAGTNIPYYLFGTRLRNEVRYVNIDAHRDWSMHRYHRQAVAEGRPHWPGYPRPGWDRARPDYAGWLANLRDAGIEYLVTTRVNPAEGPHNVADPQGFPIERGWADAHPESFRLLYGEAEGDPWFRLYRVLPAIPENLRRNGP
jgi:hypothetical protein